MFLIPNKYVLILIGLSIDLVYVVARSREPSEKGNRDRLKLKVEERELLAGQNGDSWNWEENSSPQKTGTKRDSSISEIVENPLCQLH